MLPVAHAAAEDSDVPLDLVAKDASCFFTLALSHVGQRTSEMASALRTSLSNGWWQSWQVKA